MLENIRNKLEKTKNAPLEIVSLVARKNLKTPSPIGSVPLCRLHPNFVRTSQNFSKSFLFYSIISGVKCRSGNFLKTKTTGGNSESYGQSAFFCGKINNIMYLVSRYYMQGEIPNINNVFNRSRRLQIPHFQRSYVWKEE